MQEVFTKYGINLSERELILTNAAYAAGLSDAYNQYHDALDMEDSSLVQSLKSLVFAKVKEAKLSLEQPLLKSSSITPVSKEFKSSGRTTY